MVIYKVTNKINNKSYIGQTIHDNSKEFLKFNNLKSSHISDVCLGKRQTSHGYIWKYKKT
jgi:hypothetical protein